MQNFKSKSKSTLRERCYIFSLSIIFLLDRLPNKRSAWVIGDQVMRSACSIGANLVEGRSSSSRLEFKKFYEIALKSANETRYWLGLLRDAKIVEPKILEPLLIEATELSKMLAMGVINLKQKRF